MGNIGLIAIILAVIIVVVLLMKLIKGALKFLILVAGVIIILVSFNVIKVEDVVPAQLVSITNAQVEKVTKIYDLAKVASDSVKVDMNGDKLNVSIKLNDQWVSVSDLEKIQKTASGKVSVLLNGKDIKIENDKVADVLKMLIEK